MTSVGDAKLHSYGAKHCIHAVGPNFNKPSMQQIRTIPEVRHNNPTAPSLNERAQAAAVLSTAYLNVFREFAECELATLRLVPISGGIFAGRFAKAVGELTAHAIRIAECSMPAEMVEVLRGRKIELCIFDDADFESYKRAVESRASLSGGQSTQDSNSTPPECEMRAPSYTIEIDKSDYWKVK